MFNTPGLNWTSTTVPCPFGDLCLGPPNISLNMDTGLIDSRADFGVNSDDDNLVQWRKNTTCSPIITDGYMKYGASPITGMENTTVDYAAAYYGFGHYSYEGLNDSATENATYIYTDFRDFALIDWNSMVSLYDIL